MQRFLQFGCNPLEEGDLLQEVVLHLGLEVAYSGAVEVLDLGQRGTGNDVAALVDVVRRRDVSVLLALLRFGQSTWGGGTNKRSEGSRKLPSSHIKPVTRISDH